MPLTIDPAVVAANGIWAVLFVALLVWVLRRAENDAKQRDAEAIRREELIRQESLTRQEQIRQDSLKREEQIRADSQKREDLLRVEAKERESRLLGIIDCYNTALEQIATRLDIPVPVIAHSAKKERS